MKDLGKSAHQFEYGPVAMGTYRGMLWITLATPLLGMEYFIGWALLLLFLGIGLRPLLEKTGLYRYSQHLQVIAGDKIDKEFLAKRQKKISRKLRDDRYRRRRRKHPDLPKDW